METQKILQAVESRYATKQFDPAKKIDPDLWQILEQSLILTPSSFGLQPWKFLIVTTPEIRENLRQYSYNQPQVTEASHLIVFAAKRNLTDVDMARFLNKTAEIRHIPLSALESYNQMLQGFVSAKSDSERFEWNTRQCYIALGQFMNVCAFAGIDTCPLEGISNADYDKILGLENSDYKTVVACAVGYRNPADKYATLPKVRYSAEELLVHI